MSKFEEFSIENDSFLVFSTNRTLAECLRESIEASEVVFSAYLNEIRVLSRKSEFEDIEPIE